MQLLLVCCLATAVTILSSPAGGPAVGPDAHPLANRADAEPVQTKDQAADHVDDQTGGNVPWIDCLSRQLMTARTASGAVNFSTARNRALDHCATYRAGWVAFVAEQQLELPTAAVDRFVDQVLLRVWQVRL